MQAAIELRYSPDHYTYSDVTELILDGCKIKHLTEEDATFLSTFSNLNFLSCSRTGLVSLQHLPVLPSLKKLELLDNSLTTAASYLECLATSTPNLHVLRLAGNRLKSVQKLIQDLTPLKHLEVLDVEMNIFSNETSNNEETNIANLFFSALPQLKVLDGKDRSGNDVYDDDEDEEENEEDEEDEEDRESNTTLKAFYEKDFTGEDDADDVEDFSPLNQNDEDEDDLIDDDEEDEEDEEIDNINNTDGRPTSSKRESTNNENDDESVKKQRI